MAYKAFFFYRDNKETTTKRNPIIHVLILSDYSSFR